MQHPSGVSITALKGAYDALAAYLSNISLTSDTDTTIVPDTFNQKFADYYAEVSRFSNLVAQKQADEAVDNLKSAPATISPSSLSGNGTAPKRALRMS